MDELLYESKFMLDPFRTFPSEYYLENDPIRDLMEGMDVPEVFVEGVTKSNILQKLWETIKKAGAWIANAVKKIAHTVKVFMVGESVPADRIAAKAGIPTTGVDVKDGAFDNLTDDEKADAKGAARSMYQSFVNDVTKDGIEINPAVLVAKGGKNAPIKSGKDINAAGMRANSVVLLIKDPKPLDQYIDLFTRLTDATKKQVTKEQIDKVAAICKEFSGRPSLDSYAIQFGVQKLVGVGGLMSGKAAQMTININELIEFQKKVDRICELGETFDNYVKGLNTTLNDMGKYGADIRKEYTEILNELAWLCVNLQGGLHAIAAGLAGIYYISRKYYGTVKTPEQLAAFTEEAIKTGMPAKYLVANIYSICDSSICGKEPETPLMGFGRLTLLPKGGIIYKVALNRYGIRSNKNDFMVMDSVKKTNDSQLMSMFAETSRTYGHYSVNVMEKVKAGADYEPDREKSIKMAHFINERLKNHGLSYEIYDIKPDAFGQKRGRYVILDYGYVQRTTTKSNAKFQSSGSV